MALFVLRFCSLSGRVLCGAAGDVRGRAMIVGSLGVAFAGGGRRGAGCGVGGLLSERWAGPVSPVADGVLDLVNLPLFS